MSPILVTGATGNVGRHVVEHLSASGAPVRATARHPEQLIGYPHTEAVEFDFLDAATWRAAMAGVEVMVLVRPPALGNVRRDLLPALQVARQLGVGHVVFLSLQGTERLRVVPHATIEAWLRGSGMAWTFVRPSFFVQNLSTTHAADIRDADAIRLPAGRGQTSFVDVRDVAAVIATVCREPAAHRGKAWTPTMTRPYSYAEVAALLTVELDRPIRYDPLSLPSWWRHARRDLGLSRGLSAVTAGIYTVARLGAAAGVTDDVRAVTGRAPLPLPESLHLERAAWSPPALFRPTLPRPATLPA